MQGIIVTVSLMKIKKERGYLLAISFLAFTFLVWLYTFFDVLKQLIQRCY